MSLLDQLAQEAEEQKVRQEQEAEEQEREREARERMLSERLQSVYLYFRKFRNHLEVLQPKLDASYVVHGIGELTGLRQRDYVVSADSEDLEKMTRFSFRYVYAAEEPVTAHVSHPTVIRRVKDYLKSHGLKFKVQELGKDAGQFVVQSSVPVAFEFSMDVDAGALRLNIRNLTALGTDGHRFEPDQLSAAALDEIAKCVLHQPNRLGQMTGNYLGDTTRLRLKKTVEEARQRREQELGKEAAPGKKDAKPRGRLGGLLRGR